jgi:hypothetical protein
MIAGHCLCGAVTLRATGHEEWVGACHCRMCQRWSGGVYVSFPAHGVTVTGPVTTYVSSGWAERAFCSVCGSHLWWRDATAAEGEMSLMPGLFDAARDWPLKSEIYTDRALRSLTIAGDHKRATRDEYEARNEHVEGDMA